ncbi:hypothetical protein PHAVU_001G091500 [Phaseolus vulgaris]|uniref:Uncharacterized protein n=1 Tax=Phaseolus vulgaris TaxID=3885 RepID=V7CXU5_PHAVU|nr:hypothetical protein PHAVU_001G091500g [Phaseolus vulgaris]ESW33701.1 hypothetical protein PHAVU_001G091500g [Phaseolus vulgaris]
MDGVENMDGEFEQTTLNMFIDWNDNTFQPTFFHSDTPHTAFQNFEETITELAAVLTPPKVSTQTAKGGTSITSQGAQRTPESVVNTDQNPLSASRHFVNAIYDIEFEGKCQLLGPPS